MPNVKEMVEQYLMLGHFDGLYRDCPFECGCWLNDLIPCDEPSPGCIAGVEILCNVADCDCSGKHIGPKPKGKTK